MPLFDTQSLVIKGLPADDSGVGALRSVVVRFDDSRYIPPFQDGNKRTSRLAMNVPFIRQSLAPFSFSDSKGRDYMFGLLAFYERGRHDFLAEAFTEAYCYSRTDVIPEAQHGPKKSAA